MFEIPAGIAVEIVRPVEGDSDFVDWDDTVLHTTCKRWVLSKEDVVIDPLGKLGPRAGEMIGFTMRGEAHDTDFGRWEGAILLCSYDDCVYLD